MNNTWAPLLSGAVFVAFLSSVERNDFNSAWFHGVIVGAYFLALIFSLFRKPPPQKEQPK